MFKRNHIIKITIASYIGLALTTTSFAGSREEELKNEISYLAKQLLASITIEQPAYMKPFIGICSDVIPRGIKLTCITPGHNASKAGLKTGDLIISINDVDMTGLSKRDKKNAFYDLTKSMKTDDPLALKFIRKGKERSITFKVGAVSHPAYTLTIKNK